VIASGGTQSTTLSRLLSSPQSTLNVQVKISSCSGAVVKTLVNAASEAPGSTLQVSWDGTDDSAQAVQPGSYLAQVTATDSSGLVGSGQVLLGVRNRNSTTTYAYDGLQRLTQEGIPGRTLGYGYDAVGNRTSTTDAVCGNGTASVDRAGRITQTTQGTQTTLYTVNAAGNLTNRGKDSFAYDQANRLTRSKTVGKGGGGPAWYTYDGDGRRTGTNVDQGTSVNTWDVQSATLLYDGRRTYVDGLQGLAYDVDGNGTLEVFHQDGLGSERAVSYSNGNVTQTYGTTAYGVPNAAWTQGSSNQSFQYTGQQRDVATGFVYLRARMYDPNTGRFIQQDPLRDSGPGVTGWNRYAYMGDNPVNGTDPSGFCSSQVCGPSATSDPQVLLRVGQTRIWSAAPNTPGYQQASQVAEDRDPGILARRL